MLYVNNLVYFVVFFSGKQARRLMSELAYHYYIKEGVAYMKRLVETE